MGNEFNRREFLGTLAAAVSSAANAGARSNRRTEHAADAETHIPDQTEIPDTLDLADRARIAVNALTRIVDPAHNYEPYHQAVFYARPGYMTHQEGFDEGAWAGNELWGKHVEALRMMRIMSGSEQNSEVDEKTIQGMISCFGEDNLYWKKVFRVKGDQPVPGEAHAPLLAQARVTLALLELYQLDGETQWLEIAQRSAKGLMDAAIQKEDYSYYPDSNVGGTLCMPSGGWRTKDEPAGWNINRDWHFSNSCVEFSYGAIVRAMCKLHELTGEQRPLEFAGRLVKFMLRPRMWTPDAEPKGVISVEHGHFDGHLHAYCWGFWGLLDYAELTNDARLKAFVQDGYEYARNFGISRIGLYLEGCAVGDMTNLAVRLSESGIADYWEDVDRYVRNHLVEIQLLRAGPVQQVSERSRPHQTRSFDSSEDAVERNIGALFADATHPTVATPGGIYCCTFNGLGGYYYAWKSIVRHTGGAAEVNLLLNRTSPWLDIDSYLPYEGKVVIRNKTAKVISVRIPVWVDRSAVRCEMNGNPTTPFWMGQYIVFEGCNPNHAIHIQFPVVETTETYENPYQGVSIPGHTEVTSSLGKPPQTLIPYMFRLRGNTVVKISPRDEESLGYPIYVRDQMKTTRAPMKNRSAYVASKLI